jgi:predicted transcriptional regulator
MATIVRNGAQIIITSKRAEQSSRRTKYDIWSEILQSCIKTQRTKFWLTSRLRLSWKFVDDAIRFLTTAKLIEPIKHIDETTHYKTTAKGQEALNAYELLVEKYFFP